MTAQTIAQVIEDGKAKLSEPMKVERLRAALKDLLELCEWWGVFETKDVEPYKLDAIVDDTMGAARQALKDTL